MVFPVLTGNEGNIQLKHNIKKKRHANHWSPLQIGSHAENYLTLIYKAASGYSQQEARATYL